MCLFRYIQLILGAFQATTEVQLNCLNLVIFARHGSEIVRHTEPVVQLS